MRYRNLQLATTSSMPTVRGAARSPWSSRRERANSPPAARPEPCSMTSNGAGISVGSDVVNVLDKKTGYRPGFVPPPDPNPKPRKKPKTLYKIPQTNTRAGASRDSRPPVPPSGAGLRSPLARVPDPALRPTEGLRSPTPTWRVGDLRSARGKVGRPRHNPRPCARPTGGRAAGPFLSASQLGGPVAWAVFPPNAACIISGPREGRPLPQQGTN